MALSVSKIAVLGNRSISWLNQLDGDNYQIDNLASIEQDFSNIAEQHYHLLLIDDEGPPFNVEEIIDEINRSEPLMSVVVLTRNLDQEYSLRLIELGADDVFNLNEDGEYLVRRLNLAIKQNLAKRKTMRLTRNLNAVTVLSRRLHNASHPNNLIVDALNIVSSTFNLMGLVIVLEGGNQFHLRAGNRSGAANRRIYDVMIQLHAYDPIRQSIDKGIVIAFEDLALNQYVVDLPIFSNLYSAIIVPLTYANITLGAIMALGTEANPLTRDDIVIYEHLATHLGSAYQNVRDAYTQDVTAKTSRHLLRTWQRLSRVYTSKEVDETMRILASEIIGVKHTLIWLYDGASSQPIINASNAESVRVFQNLYAMGVIDDYINQFDAQLHPLTIWLGRSNTRNIGELFQVMEAQQLILVPIKDEARLLGCILVSTNSNEQMSAEYMSLLEGIAHAAGQTLERNMLISYKDQQTERLEAITRSIKDGVFFVDGRQEVVFCNPQFTELTGISPSQVLSKSVNYLFDELVNSCDAPDQTRHQLENALQQMREDSIDQEYPIVEVNIPATESHLYIEFITLPADNNEDEKSWIGVLRHSERMLSPTSEFSSSLMNSIIGHLETSARDVYQDLLAFNGGGITKQQNDLIEQAKSQSLEIEQLLSNVQSLYRMNQGELGDLTWEDPSKILSVILNKPPLLHFESRLDVRTSSDNRKIRVNKQLFMQSMSNLVEAALLLSDDNSSIQIQMGIQANRFIFRTISQGLVIPAEKIEQVLNSPYETIQDIPYAAQLKLYFGNQVITRHEGELMVRQSVSQGMQFNVMLPLGDATEESTETDQKHARIPERKLSTVMVYDDDQFHDDVDFEFLETYDYDVIYCDHLEQVNNEIDMIRVDLIILTDRQANDVISNFVRQLRQKKSVTTPILVLSTYNEEDIRIRALRAGVDVHVGLPISNAELLAQIESLFERSKLPERVREPLSVGKLQIDFAQRQVVLEDKNLELTRIEYDLLCHLALNMGQTLTHTELLSEVWGPEYRDEKQYLWVNMSRLRRKLENTPNKTRYIFTQPGVGYILKEVD